LGIKNRTLTGGWVPHGVVQTRGHYFGAADSISRTLESGDTLCQLNSGGCDQIA
jgi:hypothetical protein